MSQSEQAETARTWPFWAPSQAASVQEALDLAGLVAGERFVDLGCGDGQVVAAAAARGAIARGIEADPELADAARSRLVEAGITARIEVGDLFDPALDLDAEVLFTYLAPATLQRLVPRLRSRRGTRLVTVDFDVPGMVPTRRGSSARLYRLPGRTRRARPTGWPSAGTLVVTVPGFQSLTCLELSHPGGPVRVRLSPPLAAVASALGGADRLDGPGQLAVDLRWDERPAGTSAAGTVSVTGAAQHAVFVVFADDDEGLWELDPDAVAALRGAIRARRPIRSAADALRIISDRG